MIPQTGLGRFFFILHIALILAQWLVPLAALPNLPEQIPVHFNFQGQADRFASKSSWELWFSPIVATVLGVFTMILLCYPRLFNVPRKQEIAALPEPQSVVVYVLMREMMLAIFVIVQALMLTVIWLIVSFATATHAPFPWPLLVSFMVAPLAVATVYLVRISRALDAAKREAGKV